MSQFERHPGRTIAVILVVALVILLVAAEAILRSTLDLTVSAPGIPGYTPSRYIELREWSPHTKLRAASLPAHAGPDGKLPMAEYPVDADGDGFIEPSRVHDKADLTIVFLGGSTTEAMYVSPEKRFPFRVGRLLEERTGLKVNSLNAAHSGNNAMLTNAILFGKVLPLHPDYVVLMSDALDVGVLRHYGTYWNASSDYGLVRVERTGFGAAIKYIRNAAIPGLYRAWRIAQLKWRRLRHKEPAAEGLPAVPAADADPAQWEGWGRAYASAIEQFVDTARAWHIRPILMTEIQLPPAGGLDAETAPRSAPLAADGQGHASAGFATAHEYFNGIVRDLAGQSNIGLVDLEASGPWTPDQFYDRSHFDDAGSERAAAIIADRLAAIIAADRAAPR